MTKMTMAKIRRHVLEHYTFEELIENIRAIRESRMTVSMAIHRFVMEGNFLIYDDDINKWLKSIGYQEGGMDFYADLITFGLMQISGIQKLVWEKES